MKQMEKGINKKKPVSKGCIVFDFIKISIC